jgi:hypothetical protein
VVKSLSEAHPDFGFASDPVDVQRYEDGRLHDCAWTPAADARKATPAVKRLKLYILMIAA